MKILGGRGVLESRVPQSCRKVRQYTDHLRQYFHNQIREIISSNINSSFPVKGLWCQTLNLPFFRAFQISTLWIRDYGPAERQQPHRKETCKLALIWEIY